MKQSEKRKKVKMFGALKQSLHEALAYEQGKGGALRVSELPLPQVCQFFCVNDQG